ncbi:isoleucyl-trna synthetase [Ceraceosorus bombacis]|uniref:isoleucine--tRNA ligase n=1 Tax=Ceraceosorus bombacis TaxID=401625 RepID=A0A0P1B8Y2_9BASI|nr:isoleucyl-trna synthetase [Ceraceosorus bombacis]
MMVQDCIARSQAPAPPPAHHRTPAGQAFGGGSSNEKLYSGTLQLPKTAFPMAASPEKREKLFRRRTTYELYAWQRENNTGPSFVLHDGPPYANGPLHIGHALNKILKDVIIRYHMLQGRRVHFAPGWDCHGLPIELKALGTLSSEGAPPTQDPLALRAEARRIAETEIDGQRLGFRSFALMANWAEQSTYRTFDLTYELKQLQIFREMVHKGLIYRAYKPVYWSHASRSALAEAELEYHEDFMSHTVFVRYPMQIGPQLRQAMMNEPGSAALANARKPISALIWTTTPWTLPSNKAVAVNPELDYSLVRVQEGPMQGETFFIGTDRIGFLSNLKLPGSDAGGNRYRVGPMEELVVVKGAQLLDSTYRHCFLPDDAEPRPILPASYVTASSGTGLVHTAPAHGAEDYELWREHGALRREQLFSPIDDEGRYTEQLRELSGGAENLIGYMAGHRGDALVIKLLEANDALFMSWHLKHSVPIDWRLKQPVMVRATSQWFADVGKIKNRALQALEKVNFFPASGKARLQSLVSGRAEWCISRQRAWGVPIPVLYDADTEEALITPENVDHIIAVLAEKGTDYWWEGAADEFVAPQYRDDFKAWRKGTDTIDVWFDSGSSWANLAEQVGAEREGQPLADVYFEGTDQHRGWFQSSLLTRIAMQDTSSQAAESVLAPYANVVTHGFVTDRRGWKMSKSLKNVLGPEFFIDGGHKRNDPAYGADPLRFWAASADYTRSVPIGTLIIKHADQALRKIRNTARFMLANISTAEIPSLEDVELSLLNRYMLHEMYVLDRDVRTAYETFDFASVVRKITHTANNLLSAFYLDIAKDILYADRANSEQRKAVLAVTDQILRLYTSVLAPITPHLAEEIHHFRADQPVDPQPKEAGAVSFFHSRWQGVDERWRDEDAAAQMHPMLELKNGIFAALEIGRKDGLLKAALETDVVIDLDASTNEALKGILERNGEELSTIFLVSHVHLSKDKVARTASAAGAYSIPAVHSGIAFEIRPSIGHKCARCRTYRKAVVEDRLCGRCEDAVQIYEAANGPITTTSP